MQEIRKASMALFGVTLLWGGTFIWMQQSLNAAAFALPNVTEDDVVVFFVMMRFVLAAAVLVAVVPRRHLRERGAPHVRRHSTSAECRTGAVTSTIAE